MDRHNLSPKEGDFGFQWEPLFGMKEYIMRKILSPFCLVLLLAGLLVTTLNAQLVFEGGKVKSGKFKMKDGRVLSGEAISPKGDGVIIRYDEGPDAGKFSSRFKWESFSQETLKEFLKDNRVKLFVEALIEIPPEQLADMKDEAFPERRPRPTLDIKPLEGAEREFKDAGFFGALFSGKGLLLALALYGANLFAAFEIGHFRNYHFALTCGVAAVVPFIGPLVFLCLPTRDPNKQPVETGPMSGDSSEEVMAAAEHAPSAEEAAPVYVEPVAVVAQIPATQVFKRGEVAINRRFIETKFAPFFRVILGDNEKDLRLVVKSTKGEFIGNRVSKVTQTDLSLQITNDAGASIEETFPITDIFEIQIRHKDAPPQ